MSLRPSETTQRILISSTSRFIGEYESDAALLTHAWPQLYDGKSSFRLSEGPMSRNGYAFSFRTPETEKAAGVVIPTYEHVGEFVCPLLSLLFGKRFDSHGTFETNGRFAIPVLTEFSEPTRPTLPQNSHKPRSDIAVILDLGQVARIEPILLGDGSSAAARSLNAASKFYWQALRSAESDSETAYLNLITAGEILSNVHRPVDEDLLDNTVKEILARIRTSLPGGVKAARVLSGRMRQIKRRFVAAISDLADDQFFAKDPSIPNGRCLTPEMFSQRIAAAYDLRSRYVHTGLSFGKWVSPVLSHDLGEVQIGRPMVGDEELATLIETAPTYLGLERTIRYCLFRFAERHELFRGTSR